MTLINFPSTPTNGDIYQTPNGLRYQYNGTYQYWKFLSRNDILIDVVFGTANAAFDEANTAGDVPGIIANGAFVTANAAFGKANTSSGGDTAGIIANAAFGQANTANFRAIGAFTKANTAGDDAGIIANAAFGKANTAGDTAGIIANGAFAKANTAGDSAGYRANGAFVTANAAFAKANTTPTTVGPACVILKTDDTSEGGELSWQGSASYPTWTTDINGNSFRIFNLSASATDLQIFSTGGGTVSMTVNTRAVKTAGKETVWVPAAAMYPHLVNGPSAGHIATGTYANQFRTLDFDPTTTENAEFAIRMPESWDEGTFTFRAVWSHAATATNFGVVWALQAIAYSDNDTGDVAFGSAQGTGDVGGVTNNIYIGGESGAMTAAGSISAQDWVLFRVWRSPPDGGDTLAIDARLHGITLYYTTNASSDG